MNGVNLTSGKWHFSDEIYVAQSSIHGVGLFARRNLSKGETIAQLNGRLVRDLHTSQYPDYIGFGRGVWVETGPPFNLINHSCAPTTAFGQRRWLMTLFDVAAGEELTVDYSTTEVDLDWEMDCVCGAPKCRGRLRSIQLTFEDLSNPPAASPLFTTIWKRHLIERHIAALDRCAEAA